MSHEHEHDHDHEHEEMDVITLTLEDDSELDCAVIGIFPFEEKDYIALLPLKGDEVDEDASVLIYEYTELEDEELELVFIEDEDYFNRVADEFESLYAEDVEDQGE
ncbi:DUF1292 domain-containing protein [Aedoeadaptatus acetigenes]|uniref:DUF1292 domain-containing protein n=1 Tax=Aedoeadaptatus acetigenes TaxID=2981723 RepID=UPI0011DCBDC9|nr:DUF1292 domain-containing protein [Aedoeadaptatus acetigenes]MCU6786340.1 DUF1292 domain-containing protein [Aedoeadaptatus acetigenes]